MEMGVERGDMVWCGVVERNGEGFCFCWGRGCWGVDRGIFQRVEGVVGWCASPRCKMVILQESGEVNAGGTGHAAAL